MVQCLDADRVVGFGRLLAVGASRRSLLPLLGLAAGLGLAGVATVSLWQSVRVADELRNLDRRQRDEFVVTRVRASLGLPSAFEHVPADRRFEIRAGRVVVPSAVGSLDPVIAPTAQDLDALVRARLDRLADKDLRAVMGAMVDDEARSDAERDWLAIDAAWRAHRAGDTEFRDTMLDGLDEAEGGAIPGSVALLWMRVWRRLPTWAPRRLAMLPAAERDGILERLTELGAATAAIRDRAVVVDRRRGLLRTVRDHWRAGALGGVESVAAWTSLVHGQLLVFHRRPGELQASGNGALLDGVGFRSWVRALEEAPDSTIPLGTADRLRPLAGDGRTARPVVAGWIGLRPAANSPTTASIWRGPGWLVVAALGLLLIAGGWPGELRSIDAQGGRRSPHAGRVLDHGHARTQDAAGWDSPPCRVVAGWARHRSGAASRVL